MEYYKIMMDISGENDVVCHFENDYGIQQYELKSGKEFNKWDGRFEFYYNEDEGSLVTDYLANDKGWFLISNRFKNLIESYNVSAQFFPANIKEKTTNKQISDFFICNVTHVVDALCLEESDYLTITNKRIGVVYAVRKYAVYESKLQGVDLFKLGNGQSIPTFISQRFKDELQSQNITGMEFAKIRTV